jgi:hypothetical protein
MTIEKNTCVKTITAKEYWNEYLATALLRTGYLPEDLYYMITTSEDLQKYITNTVVRNWYMQNDNLQDVVQEIICTRNIDDKHFSQSNDTEDLTDCINTVFGIEFLIEVLDDETAIIEQERNK